jgi:hypothetical protein
MASLVAPVTRLTSVTGRPLRKSPRQKKSHTMTVSWSVIVSVTGEGGVLPFVGSIICQKSIESPSMGSRKSGPDQCQILRSYLLATKSLKQHMSIILCHDRNDCQIERKFYHIKHHNKYMLNFATMKQRLQGAGRLTCC